MFSTDDSTINSTDNSTINSTVEDQARCEQMPSELLTQIAAGLGGSPVTDLLPDGGERRWALVLESAAYEAWVIAWPAGTGLELHDHDGSAAAIHMVSGRLRERYVDDSGELVVRWLATGDTVSLSAEHRHEMINLSTDEVISVHVYSPPLRDQSFRATRSIA